MKSSKNLGYSELETNQIESAKSNLIKASESDAFGTKQNEISQFVLTMAKNKSKFGTPEDAKTLYKLAFDIASTAENARTYSEFLYLQSNPKEALEIALPAISKDNKKALNIKLLEILVKASIDTNDSKNADYYYKNLVGFLLVQTG